MYHVFKIEEFTEFKDDVVWEVFEGGHLQFAKRCGRPRELRRRAEPDRVDRNRNRSAVANEDTGNVSVRKELIFLVLKAVCIVFTGRAFEAITMRLCAV